MIKIELFSVPGCEKCASARNELRAVAASVLGTDDMAWRDINVLDEIDYAVSLGVLTTPAVAINGRLVFSALPTAAQWRDALARVEAC